MLRLLRRAASLARDALLILGITLLLLLVLEGGLRLLAGEPASVDRRAGADAYGGAAWAADLWLELEDSRGGVNWRPFVYWRRAPYQGKYVHVGADGRRFDPAQAAPPAVSGKPLRIFMFGGSTMWGHGARDAGTIPAHLAAQLAAAGTAAEVINFGETGYVSNQEVITLLLELQRGNVPDLVIFMDGVNDTFSGFQNQVAGVSQNEANRTREFNLLQSYRYPDLLGAAIRGLPKQLAIRAWLKQFREKAKADPAADLAVPGPPPALAAADKALATAVVGTVLANVRIVEALGDRYGFQTLWYWQPNIFAKRELTAYEQGERQLARSWEALFLEADRQAAQVPSAVAGVPGFRNVNDLFAGTPGPVFVDWCHLSEEGNATLASRMRDDILALRPTAAPGQ